MKKRKRGGACEFCGLQVLRNPDLDDDQPAWWSKGLDQYMEKPVRVNHDGALFEGKVMRFVMSAAVGETNVPAIFEIEGALVSPSATNSPSIIHKTKREVDDGMRAHNSYQREKRQRR